MTFRPWPALTSLGRVLWLDLQWNLRAPQSVLFQIFTTLALLVLFRQVNDSPAYLEILVPGLIGLLTASSSFQGLGSTVAYMRTYGAWRTLRASPIPLTSYLGGMVAGRLVRTLLTAALLTAFAHFVFGYRFTGSVTLLALYLTVGVTVFGALGLVFAHTGGTPQGITGALNAGLLAMVFLGNSLFIGKTPWLQALAALSPLTYLNALVRNNAQGLATPSSVLPSLAVLGLWGFAAATLAVVLAHRRVEEA